MTTQEIKDHIIACAARLQHVPTLDELTDMTSISHRQIRRHFGGYLRALEECELEPREIGRGAKRISLERLFLDWAGIVRQLQKLPTRDEYLNRSRYSSTPLLRRFRTWENVPHALKEFAERRGLAADWQVELALVPARCSAHEAAQARESRRVLWLDRPVYGTPLVPGPMLCAPTNENGVIFLFGALAVQLGFAVDKLQSGFPDGQALRRVGQDEWRYVRIEFEFESRNFQKHMHDPNGCDLIVCWRHNWPECPLEVIELQSEMLKPVLCTKCALKTPSAGSTLSVSLAQGN